MRYRGSRGRAMARSPRWMSLPTAVTAGHRQLFRSRSWRKLTRFRIPWRWNGGPAILKSRATDEGGYVQPTRAQMLADRGMNTIYHFNAIASWAVGETGEVR